MESIWTSMWFERLLQKQTAIEAEDKSGPETVSKEKIFVADRSPYSAVLYARGGYGSLLEPLIRRQTKELADQANIRVYTVCIKVR